VESLQGGRLEGGRGSAAHDRGEWEPELKPKWATGVPRMRVLIRVCAGPRSEPGAGHSRTRSCRKQGAAGISISGRCFGTQRASRRDQPNSTWFLRPYDYFEWE